jgi:hypothetical protein
LSNASAQSDAQSNDQEYIPFSPLDEFQEKLDGMDMLDLGNERVFFGIVPGSEH